MKVIILEGGKGTRISEETDIIPKPLIEIGAKPTGRYGSIEIDKKKYCF